MPAPPLFQQGPSSMLVCLQKKCTAGHFQEQEKMLWSESDPVNSSMSLENEFGRKNIPTLWLFSLVSQPDGNWHFWKKLIVFLCVGVGSFALQWLRWDTKWNVVLAKMSHGCVFGNAHFPSTLQNGMEERNDEQIVSQQFATVRNVREHCIFSDNFIGS